MLVLVSIPGANLGNTGSFLRLVWQPLFNFKVNSARPYRSWFRVCVVNLHGLIVLVKTAAGIRGISCDLWSESQTSGCLFSHL